jgi:glycerol-3-phosphate acyltransferase PlsX
MTTIAIDILGGDEGYKPIVAGLVLAMKQDKSFKAILVGKQEDITYPIPKKFEDRVEYIQCYDVISMTDHATDALKRKNSSAYIAIDLVKQNKADAYVSAGHSGASMSLATLRIGRIKGVSRPAIATIMPTISGTSLVLDVGANVDCDANNLKEFAIMGQVYASDVLGIDKPLVGLLSNGEEESKGNETTKDAFKLCENIPSFIGNVEGNDIFNGTCDVIVCDGFVGNIMLKTAEGVADTITGLIKQNLRRSLVSITGAVLMRKVFKNLKLKVDYAEYGGAPLLGVKAPVIIAHGKSNAKAIKNAIFQAISVSQSNLNEDIENKLQKHKG